MSIHILMHVYTTGHMYRLYLCVYTCACMCVDMSTHMAMKVSKHADIHVNIWLFYYRCPHTARQGIGRWPPATATCCPSTSRQVHAHVYTHAHAHPISILSPQMILAGTCKVEGAARLCDRCHMPDGAADIVDVHSARLDVAVVHHLLIQVCGTPSWHTVMAPQP